MKLDPTLFDDAGDAAAIAEGLADIDAGRIISHGAMRVVALPGDAE